MFFSKILFYMEYGVANCIANHPPLSGLGIDRNPRSVPVGAVMSNKHYAKDELLNRIMMYTSPNYFHMIFPSNSGNDMFSETLISCMNNFCQKCSLSLISQSLLIFTSHVSWVHTHYIRINQPINTDIGQLFSPNLKLHNNCQGE